MVAAIAMIAIFDPENRIFLFLYRALGVKGVKPLKTT